MLLGNVRLTGDFLYSARMNANSTTITRGAWPHQPVAAINEAQKSKTNNHEPRTEYQKR